MDISDNDLTGSDWEEKDTSRIPTKNKETWQKHFEANMLDGDSITKGQTMLEASHVFEYITQVLKERDEEWMQEIEEINQSILKTIDRRDEELVERIESIEMHENYGLKHKFGFEDAKQQIKSLIKSRE